MGRKGMTCSTCFFWLHDPEHPCGWGACIKTTANDGEPEYPRSLAHAVGGGTAELVTAPEFGCVQWVKTIAGPSRHTN